MRNLRLGGKIGLVILVQIATMLALSVQVVLAGAAEVIANSLYFPGEPLALVVLSQLFTFAVLLLIVASYAAQIRRDRRAEAQEAAEASFAQSVDPFAGGHPVPPMPGQELLEPITVPAVEQEPRDA